MVNGRRSEFEIIKKILDLSKDGAKKTKLLYQGNLSYNQLKSYLLILVEKNILEINLVNDNGKTNKYYKITKKCYDLLNYIKKTLDYFK